MYILLLLMMMILVDDSILYILSVLLLQYTVYSTYLMSSRVIVHLAEGPYRYTNNLFLLCMYCTPDYILLHTEYISNMINCHEQG